MRHPFLRTLAGSAAPAATDPNFENVILLLHGDGTNGGQNNTFVDGSTNNFTITRNGNTTQGTFSPYGDNWSNYFDGSGDYLSRAFTSTTDGMYPQGTTYTIEAWFYASLTTNVRIIYDCSASNVTNFGGVWLGMNAGAAQFNCRPTTGGTLASISGGSIVTNSWNHIAISVNAGSGRLFLNGTQVGSTTTISACSFTPVGASVGRLSNGYTVGVSDYAGYISNVRMVQSTAIYTANFTPPTAPLTAITNTSLLTCQSNRFRDASTNNFTITSNGDVSVQRFSPFSPTAAYAAGTIGGSGYFDGTGDYLSFTGTGFNVGTGAFTLEGWIYPSANQYSGIVSTWLTTSGSVGFLLGISNTRIPEFFIGNAFGSGNSTGVVGATAIPLNAWTHLAATKAAGSGGTMTLYVNGVSVGTNTTTRSVDRTAAVIGRYYQDFNGNYLTGLVSDVRVSNVVRSISVPASPISSDANTLLLASFANAGVLDNAMMAVPETVGNAQIDTTTKKFGTGSLEFDGTGDWLRVQGTPNLFNLSTGDFTIECWFYAVSTGTSAIVQQGTTDWRISYTSNGVMRYEVGANSIQTSTGAFSFNTWTHLAICKSGTTTTLYLDGTSRVTTTNSPTNSGNPVYVGANIDGGSPYWPLNGYIDDLRITKGVARYTANFTPPTAAFPDL